MQADYGRRQRARPMAVLQINEIYRDSRPELRSTKQIKENNALKYGRNHTRRPKQGAEIPH